MSRRLPPAALVLLTLSVVTALAGCGNRGDLYREPPPAAEPAQGPDDGSQDGSDEDPDEDPDDLAGRAG